MRKRKLYARNLKIKLFSLAVGFDVIVLFFEASTNGVFGAAGLMAIGGLVNI